MSIISDLSVVAPRSIPSNSKQKITGFIDFITENADDVATYSLAVDGVSTVGGINDPVFGQAVGYLQAYCDVGNAVNKAFSLATLRPSDGAGPTPRMGFIPYENDGFRLINSASRVTRSCAREGIRSANPVGTLFSQSLGVSGILAGSTVFVPSLFVGYGVQADGSIVFALGDVAVPSSTVIAPAATVDFYEWLKYSVGVSVSGDVMRFSLSITNDAGQVVFSDGGRTWDFVGNAPTAPTVMVDLVHSYRSGTGSAGDTTVAIDYTNSEFNLYRR
jgi:hypothetical protein